MARREAMAVGAWAAVPNRNERNKYQANGILQCGVREEARGGEAGVRRLA